MADIQAGLVQRSSSTGSAKSAYDKTVAFDPESSHHPILELGIYHVGSHLHSDLEIKSSTCEPLYYVNCVTFSEEGYDMTVHKGESKNGPIVGACSFNALSMNLNIALGDPFSMKVEWDQILAKSVLSATFTFTIVMASGAPEKFEWRRSHGKDVQSVGGKWFSMRNMILVRLADEKTYGVYVDNMFKSWSKVGKIQFRQTEELGEAGEFAAMVAILSVNEKLRRHLRGTTGYQAGGKFPI